MKTIKTRDELVEIVRKIMNSEGTEEELDEMIDLFNQNVPHPEASDLIFWDNRNLTVEEIVEEALNYKPIILP
ncbi:bacteriocin immunity protein [Thermoactinomyces sp. DSM 45892]|uniref:bacteriocin immunity protein n=1 Tax=Thermoactinomyces sp. DSM 45892 TaxID=1882753 RepID=UPI000894CD20|nr:bacteriocin immunity protein [Thermoactinomyces sp. DSM 45892]SDY69996.1 Colicin immunity protein / pyocin immunity protein [Thermoactinomyces sp. DSM 45892]